jgi:hypothetical protein
MEMEMRLNGRVEQPARQAGLMWFWFRVSYFRGSQGVVELRPPEEDLRGWFDMHQDVMHGGHGFAHAVFD